MSGTITAEPVYLFIFPFRHFNPYFFLRIRSRAQRYAEISRDARTAQDDLKKVAILLSQQNLRRLFYRTLKIIMKQGMII